MDRSTISQERSADHDFSEFAQEFLRRNKVYREQFAGARLETPEKMQSFAARRMARSWGLEFSFRPLPARGSLAGYLAP